MTPRPLTVSMLADRWRTSDTFVYDQIKAGRLRAFRLGGKLIRITEQAVAEFEEAAQIGLRPAPVTVSEARDLATIGRLIRAA